MPRLFTGLDLPEPVRERLARLKMPLPGARWVEPDDLHVTLRFAGDIGERAADEFADALSRVSADAFDIKISGLGAFGGNDPHTLYASIAPNPALDALARANERAARAAGLPAEGRNFHPHVTLARMRNADATSVARFLARHGGLSIEPFRVAQFFLFSSRPQVGGGPYVVEAAYDLRGSSSGYAWSGRPA